MQPRLSHSAPLSNARCCTEHDHALRIRLLGGFRIEIDGRVVPCQDWRLLRARALVKLLALAPQHRLVSDELMETLWPEAEPLAARNSLYYALHVARSALGK